MTARIGKLSLLRSETIVQLNNTPVRVVLEDKIEGDYKFDLVFVDDAKEPKVITRTEAVDNLTVRINFINFNRSKEASNVEPLSLGTHAKRPLFLNYFINSFSTTARVIVVNFLVEDK